MSPETRDDGIQVTKETGGDESLLTAEVGGVDWLRSCGGADAWRGNIILEGLNYWNSN